MTRRLGWNLDPVRGGVIINMLFNPDRRRLMRFKNTIQAILGEDWDRAACEMLDSKWSRQVKGRAGPSWRR